MAEAAFNVTTEQQYVYPGAEELHYYNQKYVQAHGYIAVVVCVLGIIANLLNIVVLAQKEMRSSVNWILCALAVSDGLTMAAYLPFALRFYCLYGTSPTPERNTLPAVRFMLFYACFSVYVHTVSIWLTVILAIFRYIFISAAPHTVKRVCSEARAKLAISLTYFVTLIVCVPNFVLLNIVPYPAETGNGTLWLVKFREDTRFEQNLYNFNFWVQAIVVKLLPCCGLTVVSVIIVRKMNKVQRQHQKLMKTKNAGGTSDRLEESKRKSIRATRMLLTVVALFLLTEFPIGIMSLLSGILNKFYDEVYGPLGDTMDILALINNGINFLLYCSMSKQFRDTFIRIFLNPVRHRRDKFFGKFSLVPQSQAPAETAATVL